MLIAFEGQDGASKTSLLRATCTELTRQSIPAITVDEFSDSPYGQRLVDALARDKFLRPVLGEPATVLTRALEIVADLYYLDERVIAPALEAGYVVLKDRHMDTIFYTLLPALVQPETAHTESRALTWLSMMLSQLRYRPTVTVYVDAPLAVRLERIKKRPRQFDEDRARKVSRADLEVIAARERVVRHLMAAEPERFLTIVNDRPLPEGMAQVLGLIHAWRSGVS
jgi:thymidylate kinase